MSVVDKIKNKFGKSGQTKINDEDVLVQIHHVFNREYGWIPLEEFKKIPLPTIWNLLECIGKDKEAEHEAMEKSTRKK